MTALLAALACAAKASGARATARLDAAFVNLLSRAGARRHPLADPTGRLPVVLELPVGVDARAMGWQPLGAGLAGVRLLPGELLTFEARYPAVRFSIWPPLHRLLDESVKLNGTSAYRASLARVGSPIAGTGRGVVVGIIDSGIDVTHPDFRDEVGGTRIAWLLDFSSSPLLRHPQLETDFGCDSPTQAPCAVLDKNDIDQALGGDVRAYLPSDPLGHGTHVASIAAGSGGGPNARFVGGAPGATLVIASVAHGALGSATDIDIVTSARFIFDRAEQMGMPAVVNVSLGGDFGPHDGTTPLEKALAELVGPDHRGRSIVVAAGNSGALYQGDRPEQTFGIHSETRVTRGVPARLSVLTPDAKQDADVSGRVFVWLTYSASDDISVGLRGPNGLSISSVERGKKAGSEPLDDRLTAAIYNGVVGDGTPLTSDTHGAIVIWKGTWPAAGQMAIEIEGEGFVEAWLEAVFDSPSADESAYFEKATRQGTISVPATHPDLIAVGCTINRTRWTDRDGAEQDIAQSAYDILSPADGTCYFSSAGPTATGVRKPEISAPGAMVIGAMSKDAVPAARQTSIFDAPHGLCMQESECLVIDATHALLSGSSMSSPQVAGAIALLLERDATLTQPEILRLLEQGARRPTGRIGTDFQLGAGGLDVVGAMAALEARASRIEGDPDLSASWLSLSGGYLHPGAGSPVMGTVEVRTVSAGLADGFDVRRLSLAIGPEGMVREPLTRVAPGLFRFAVSAGPETGSRIMQLDVRLDGGSIGVPGTRLSGHRLLPIGADRWIAFGTARAYGGCSVGWAGASPGLPRAGLVTWLWMAGAVTAVRWPRSTRSRAVRREPGRDRRDRRARDPRY